MKEYTPARAKKALDYLSEERRRLLDREYENCTYRVEEGQKGDAPEYSYGLTRTKVAELDRKTQVIRHALRQFDVQTVLPEAGITVDEGLIRLSLLGKEKKRLAALRDIPEKRRAGGALPFGGSYVEYEHANFDLERAARDYRALCEDMAELQLEISLVNNTKTFTVDI